MGGRRIVLKTGGVGGWPKQLVGGGITGRLAPG